MYSDAILYVNRNSLTASHFLRWLSKLFLIAETASFQYPGKSRAFADYFLSMEWGILWIWSIGGVSGLALSPFLAEDNTLKKKNVIAP